MPRSALLLAVAVLLAGCTPIVDSGVAGAATATTAVEAHAHTLAPSEGIASWYGPGFAGRHTANGEIFDPSELTAAHKTLPFDTRVRVTNLANGKSVVVRINDRGPFKPGRVVDLSRGAAERIGMMRSGTARVRVEPIPVPTGLTVAAGHPSLSGYEVMSAGHQPGQLLLLSSPQTADEVVVRVVSGSLPPGTGARLLLAPELYALLGENVAVRVE